MFGETDLKVSSDPAGVWDPVYGGGRGMQLIPRAVLSTYWPLREHGSPSEGRGL